jgi:hypothetical protein
MRTYKIFTTFKQILNEMNRLVPTVNDCNLYTFSSSDSFLTPPKISLNFFLWHAKWEGLTRDQNDGFGPKGAKKNCCTKLCSALPNFVHYIYFDGKQRNLIVNTIFRTILTKKKMRWKAHLLRLEAEVVYLPSISLNAVLQILSNISLRICFRQMARTLYAYGNL